MDLRNRDLGRYRVIDRLGAGGMGETYRARDQRLRRDVAIKVLPPERVADEEARRLLRGEALSLSRLNHPGIATVHDFDSVEGIDFLVMELIDGVSLASRIGDAALPEREAIEYGRAIAEAIDAAHAAGIVHGDLKPANVLITRDGRIKVIDFGLARVLEPANALETTRSGITVPAFAGTVPYMSPEQLRAEGIDARSDVYALGVLLYEMVTGLRPFRDPVLPRLMDAILHDAPVPARTLNPAVSVELQGLILACLAKEPGRRPQSAGEVARVLERLASGRAAPAPSVDSTVVTAAAASILSLVALPARVVGAEKDQFLSDAVANTLTAELARHGGLDMKSPPTSEDVARVGGDLARIAAAYRTNACVVTTVTATPRKLALSLQLVEAASRRVLWARELQGARRAYVELLREAAGDIRQRLNVSPGGADSARTHGSGSRIELALQRASYYANLFANRGRAGDLERATAAYGEVLAADSRSAAALEGLAVLQLSRIVVGTPAAEAAREAERYARRALAIDPRIARAWSVLSDVEAYAAQPDFLTRLECAFRGAWLGADDDYTHGRLGASLASSSAILAREAMHEAARLEPLVINSHVYEAIVSAALGDAARGLECIDRVLALEPDAPFSLYVKVLILVVAGREQEAAALADQLGPLGAAGRLHPEWVRFAGTIARARGILGSGGPGADELLAYLLKASCGELAFPRWQGTTSGVPMLLARYGRGDAAMDLLLARREAGLREPLDLLVLHEDLTTVRSDPRWASLVHDAAQLFRVMLEAIDHARTRGELPEYVDRALPDLLSRPAVADAIGR